MPFSTSNTERIVVVGAGFSGLAAATRLAQAGFPVTLIEASKLGYAASTRNQGWLHSGASFAKMDPELARRCYGSLRQTLKFCPECLEPDVGPMIYGSLTETSKNTEWIEAWEQAGIPYSHIPRGELAWELPEFDRDRLTWALRLPDRSFRPHLLLEALARVAKESGVEIRSGTIVSSLLFDERHVYGVRIGANEEIRAKLVVLAIGVASGKSFRLLFQENAGGQSDYQLVYVKTHLLAVEPELNLDAFLLVDEDCLNHIPHSEGSVFGTNRWQVVADPKDHSVDPAEIQIIDERIENLLQVDPWMNKVRKEWAGTTVQAMHADQVDPALAFRPTIIDHSRQPGGVENVLSIFPGRATMWAELADMVQHTVFKKTNPSSTETAKPPWLFEE